MVDRTNQDHNTPPEWVAVVRELASVLSQHGMGPGYAGCPIALDPCSNPWSRVGALVELSLHAGDNGLEASWAELSRGGLTYSNPVYENITPWVRKANDEAEDGAEVAMLVPGDDSTAWSRFAKSTCDAYADPPRIAFVGAGGNGAKQPSRFYYWGAGRWLFAHVFEQAGCSIRLFDRRSPP